MSGPRLNTLRHGALWGSADLIGASAQGFDLRALMKEAPIIPETMDAPEVIARLRTAAGQMLLVYDEYGHFEGVVTPMDVLEAITGEFAGLDDDEPKLVEREDGSMLVDGTLPTGALRELLGGGPLPGENEHIFHTAAGMTIARFSRIPNVAEYFEWHGWRIEVVDLDGRRIDKLLVERAA